MTAITTPEIHMVAGDRLPLLRLPLTYLDCSPIDLTEATGVTFKMWLIDHPETVVINDETAEFVTPRTLGHVQYAWRVPDATLPAAIYVGRFKVVYNSLALTVPGGGLVVVYLHQR